MIIERNNVWNNYLPTFYPSKKSQVKTKKLEKTKTSREKNVKNTVRNRKNKIKKEFKNHQKLNIKLEIWRNNIVNKFKTVHYIAILCSVVQYSTVQYSARYHNTQYNKV